MKTLATLLVMLAAQPAFALSCARPDVVRDYQQAAASPDRWIVVEGDLTLTGAFGGAKGNTKGKESVATSLEGHIRGMALTRSGFDQPFDRALKVRLTCAGPWCGQIEPGNYLLFVKQEVHGLALIVGPCGTFVHRNPTETQLDAVAACMSDGC